jgi:hypothetical protein
MGRSSSQSHNEAIETLEKHTHNIGACKLTMQFRRFLHFVSKIFLCYSKIYYVRSRWIISGLKLTTLGEFLGSEVSDICRCPPDFTPMAALPRELVLQWKEVLHSVLVEIHQNSTMGNNYFLFHCFPSRILFTFVKKLKYILQKSTKIVCNVLTKAIHC